MTRLMRILIVENDTSVAEFYSHALERAGYQTRVVGTGAEALAAIGEFVPDLVLLDLGLDGRLDGFDVLSAVRRRSDVRVVIVTARDFDDDLEKGLGMGASNYVVKPVSARELVARVRAALRYNARNEEMPTGIYAFPEVTINLAGGYVVRGKRQSALGLVERRLLARLLQTPGQTVTNRELLRAGWGIDRVSLEEDDMRMLSTAIYRLRAKVECVPRQPRLIRRVLETGYYFATSPEESPAVRREGFHSPAAKKPRRGHDASLARKSDSP